MRVLIAAGNASERMGGEAVLPLRYFVGLRRRGVDAFLITHARCRQELEQGLGSEKDHVFYVEDHYSEILVYKIGLRIPHHVREVLFLPLVHAITDYRLGRTARKLCALLRVDLLHQPIPVSPRAPSFFFRQPAAVVIGPMNGNMDYPTAFRHSYARGTLFITHAIRRWSGLLNLMFPGKTEAACLLAANERTALTLRTAFPRAKIRLLSENGVDLQAWPRPSSAKFQGTPRFLFVGRLVHWKAVDILIDAFDRAVGPAELIIIGDGPEREKLERQALTGQRAHKRIRFLGYLHHCGIRREMTQARALVLPSLREAGGAVILEAMASALPVIATKWGGPEDYVTSGAGFLVEPRNRDYMVQRIAELIDYLAHDQEEARAMGERGRAHIEKRFSWDAKIDQMITIYRAAIETRSATFKTGC